MLCSGDYQYVSFSKKGIIRPTLTPAAAVRTPWSYPVSYLCLNPTTGAFRGDFSWPPTDSSSPFFFVVSPPLVFAALCWLSPGRSSGRGVAVEQLASKSIKEVLSEPEGQRLAQVTEKSLCVKYCCCIVQQDSFCLLLSCPAMHVCGSDISQIVRRRLLMRPQQ